MTYSSKLTVCPELMMLPPSWLIANARFASRCDRLEYTSGRSAPLTAAVGRSVISLVTPRSNRSVQNISTDIVLCLERARSFSLPLAKSCVKRFLS